MDHGLSEATDRAQPVSRIPLLHPDPPASARCRAPARPHFRPPHLHRTRPDPPVCPKTVENIYVDYLHAAHTFAHKKNVESIHAQSPRPLHGTDQGEHCGAQPSSRKWPRQVYPFCGPRKSAERLVFWHGQLHLWKKLEAP